MDLDLTAGGFCGVVLAGGTAARMDGVRPGLEAQHNMALHRLLGQLRLADVRADGDEAIDIDAWTDLRDLGG